MSSSERMRHTGDLTVSVREASARCGLSIEEVTALWEALGFHVSSADAPAFADADVASLTGAKAALQVFSWDEFVYFLRTVSVAVNGITEAAHNLFAQDVFTSLVNAGASESERMRAQAEADAAAHYVEPLLGMLFRHHFRRTIEQYHAHHEREVAQGLVSTVIPMGIGFVDLVGFTSSSLRMSPEELLSVVTRFEATAHSVITRHGGRLVKLIGDEVMFSATDADVLCDIAVALFQEFTGDSALTPRGGLAFGGVLPRGNDFYGPIVNLASRVGGEAVPGEVLVSPEVADRASRHVFEPAGRRELKGFSEPVRVSSLLIPDKTTSEGQDRR